MLSSPTPSRRNHNKSFQKLYHDRFLPQISNSVLYRLSSTSSYSPRVPLRSPKTTALSRNSAPGNSQFLHVLSDDNDRFPSPQQTIPFSGLLGNTNTNNTAIFDPPFHLAIDSEEDSVEGVNISSIEYEENIDIFHNNGIAKALKFPVASRMFHYTPNSKRKFGERYVTYSPATKTCSSSPAKTLLKSPSLQHSFTGQSFNDYEDLSEEYDYFDHVDPDKALASQTDDEKLLPDIVNLIPYRILDASGLGNDFYSNLVSWSKLTSQVAVGLRDKVYIWAKNRKVLHVNIPDIFGEVTCVSFSPNFSESLYFDGVSLKRFCDKRTNFLAVGYRDGTLVIYDVDAQTMLGYFTQVTGAVDYICWIPPKELVLEQEKHENTYNQNCKNASNESNDSQSFLASEVSKNLKPFLEPSMKSEKPEGSDENNNTVQKCQHILIGDEMGSVYRLGIFWGEGNWICNGKNFTSFLSDIKQQQCLTGHTHKICAISLNHDSTELAIGGNDSRVTIWDVSNWQSPKLKYTLVHRAAVKAMEYCPWAPCILATGAGSQDRTVRFWHTRSGTLLKEWGVKGQVTSVIWSRHKRQIAVTFGFTDAENPTLLAIYAFPQGNRAFKGKFGNSEFYAIGDDENELGDNSIFVQSPVKATEMKPDPFSNDFATGSTQSSISSSARRRAFPLLFTTPMEIPAPEPIRNIKRDEIEEDFYDYSSDSMESWVTAESYPIFEDYSFDEEDLYSDIYFSDGTEDMTADSDSGEDSDGTMESPLEEEGTQTQAEIAGNYVYGNFNPSLDDTSLRSPAIRLARELQLQWAARMERHRNMGHTMTGGGYIMRARNTASTAHLDIRRNLHLGLDHRYRGIESGRSQIYGNSLSSQSYNGKSRRKRAYGLNRPLVQVRVPAGLRVLSASLSPDTSSICVCTNDETVRFFKLWPTETLALSKSICQSSYFPYSKIIGSDLLELQENIENIGDIIR